MDVLSLTNNYTVYESYSQLYDMTSSQIKRRINKLNNSLNEWNSQKTKYLKT